MFIDNSKLTFYINFYVFKEVYECVILSMLSQNKQHYNVFVYHKQHIETTCYIYTDLNNLRTLLEFF